MIRQIILAFVVLVLIAVFLPVLGPKSSQATCDLRFPADPSTACGRQTQAPAQDETNVSLAPSFHWDYGGYRPGETGCADVSGCGLYRAVVYLAKTPAIAINPGSEPYVGVCDQTASSPIKDASFSCFGVAGGSLEPNTDYWWIPLVAYNVPTGWHTGYSWRYHFKTGNPIPPLQHKECRSNACVLVDGAGSDNCPNNCQPQTHFECQNNACVLVNGAGDNLCANRNDCAHNICQNQTCVLVSGAGADQCTSNTSCQTPTHLACQNSACVVVSGPGQNSCNSDADCVPVTHKECRNNACTVITGPGQNSCGVDNDCVPQNHKACVILACQLVSGPGSDSCSSDSDCFHLACQGNSCVRVSGGGGNSCSSDSNCVTAAQQPVCDSLSVSTNSGDAPLTINASLSGHTINGGSIVSYRFNFGDGSADQVQNNQTISHTYSTPGTFVATGYVLDNLGNIAGGTIACQKVVSVFRPQVLGVATPPVIPRTGAETTVLLGLLGSSVLGWALKKWRG